jgi:hypothetical protein
MSKAYDPNWPYCYWKHPRDRVIISDTVDRSRRRGTLITLREIMRHYDSLPPEVRRTLANAEHPWAPTWCLNRLCCGWTSARIIARLGEADRKRREQHELVLVGLTREPR